jgi:phosphate transport system substrate-binding protein
MFNKKVISVVAGLATVASLAISGPAAFASQSLTAGGSSFAGGMLKACAASWSHGGDSVNYTSSSSGTGRSSFNGGAFDFGAADAPYGGSDAKPADLVYVPLVAGPVAVGFNVPGVANLNLTPSVLGGILSHSITKWNDAAIKNLNKSAKLPSQNIVIVYRNTTSGTTQNFTKYLSQTAPGTGWSENSAFGSGGGYVGSGSHGEAASIDVVNYIDTNAYTIGYADLKDTLSAHLTFAALQNGNGQFVKPTVATAGKFLSNQSGNVAANGLVSFDYTARVAGAYNLDLVTYGLAHTTTSAKGATTKAFFSYVINSCSPSNASRLGYVALPGAIKTKALALVRTVK